MVEIAIMLSSSALTRKTGLISSYQESRMWRRHNQSSTMLAVSRYLDIERHPLFSPRLGQPRVLTRKSSNHLTSALLQHPVTRLFSAKSRSSGPDCAELHHNNHSTISHGRIKDLGWKELFIVRRISNWHGFLLSS